MYDADMTRPSLNETSPAQVLGHPLFAGAPPEVAALLLRDAAILHKPDGGVLFREGAQAIEYLYVLAGGVEVLRHTRDQQDRVFHIFTPGQMLAESAMFMSHGRYPMQARARGDSVVLCLKRQGLLDACRFWPDLSLRMLTRLSDRVYHRVNEVEWFSDSTAGQRLADYLLRHEDLQGAIHLLLTQRQLALHLGVRAETLSRLLADWVDQGAITGSRRHWVIQKPEFLSELARSARRNF